MSRPFKFHLALCFETVLQRGMHQLLVFEWMSMGAISEIFFCAAVYKTASNAVRALQLSNSASVCPEDKYVISQLIGAWHA